MYFVLYIVNCIVSGEIYTAGKNFTGWTNSTSVWLYVAHLESVCIFAVISKTLLRILFTQSGPKYMWVQYTGSQRVNPGIPSKWEVGEKLWTRFLSSPFSLL